MDFTQEIKELRAEGKTYQEISIKLNLSIGKVQRLLKADNDISIKVGQDGGTSSEMGQETTSPAPQGLVNDYVTRKEIDIILEEFKALVERVIEEKSNRAMSYFIENNLNSLVERVINEKIKDFQLRERREGTGGI